MSRGYFSTLLEEIALEGLDGITLDVLWIRLENNPDWCLKPIDNNVQEFIWRKLKTLQDVRWYNIKHPRKTPPIFKCFEDFVDAVEKEDIQPNTFSSACYPHLLIRDGDIVGSCATYHERIDVTSEVQKLDLSEANERYPNQLVIVANQDVRNHFLLASNLNPEADIADISYCILERIGRSRCCGEVSCGIQFLKNGANPTFYFWNKLKKLGLITFQTTNFFSKLSNTTLFHLPKYHRSSKTSNAVYRVVSSIKSSSYKCLPVADVKAMFPDGGQKVTMSPSFQRFLKTEVVPFKECYPNYVPKTGDAKYVKVVKLRYENIDQEIIPQPPECDDENEKNGVLEGDRLVNRPLVVQCYKHIHEKGVEGATLMEIGATLGLNKLSTRLVVKTLKKLNVVTCLYFYNGRQRYYRYYSKELEIQVGENLKKQPRKTLLKSRNFYENNPSSNEMPVEKCVEKLREIEKKSMSLNVADESCAVKGSDASTKRKISQKAEKSSNPIKKHKVASSNALSTSKNKWKTSSKKQLSFDENVCLVHHTSIILKYLSKRQVILRSNLLKLIKKEEKKLGVSTARSCWNSVKRLLRELSRKNKLKEIHKVVVEERFNIQRKVFFICAPTVTEDHPIIQTHLANVRNSLSNKKLRKIRSKFYGQFHSKGDYSTCGMAPKFARMRILHKFLVFLVYHYDGDENLNPDDCTNYIKLSCSNFDDSDEIPKVYFKEVSPRMFVPPLTKYKGGEDYNDGWTSVNDIAERIPLRMLFSLVRFSRVIPEIDAYLFHPVKQFYLLRHLPYEIQQKLTADEKYISSIYEDLKNLCLIGLAQLGPRIEDRGSLNLIYMNKKAELLDTRPCLPAQLQINLNLNYTKYDYDFVASKNTEIYWNDAFRFCIATQLCRKLSSTKLATESKGINPALQICLSEHQINEASHYDTGKIPGDGLGAAGYDSSLFSHLRKQWFPPNNRKTAATASTISKLVAKQMHLKRSTQLKRMRLTSPTKKYVSFDKMDPKVWRKIRSRSKWSKNENEILSICYIAAKYCASLGVKYPPGRVYRQLLQAKSVVSASKTGVSCVQRVKNIMRNPSRTRKAELLLQELLSDEDLKKNVQSIIKESNAQSNSTNSSQCFKQIERVFNLLYANSLVRRDLSSSKKSEPMLPDSLDKFRKQYNVEYVENTRKKVDYSPLESIQDINVTILTALLYSTLFSLLDRNKSINMDYLSQIFKYFNNDHLNLALSFVQSNKLFAMDKYKSQRKSMLPFGKGNYHFSKTFHAIVKSICDPKLFGLIYERYLELLQNPESNNFETDTFDIALNLIEIAFMTHDKITFDVKIPANVMYFERFDISVVNPEKQDMFLKNNKNAKEVKSSSILTTCFDDENSKDALNDDALDDDLTVKPDDELETFMHSKRCRLSMVITRKERFLLYSYEHYFINKFPVSCKLNSNQSHFEVLGKNVDREFFNEIERNSVFTKKNYNSVELTNVVKQLLPTARDRDYALSFLNYLQLAGVKGSTTEMIMSVFKDFKLLKKVSDVLIEKKIIIRSGNECMRYIHIDYIDHWTVPCWKYMDASLRDKSPEESTQTQPAVTNRLINEKFKSNNDKNQVWLAIRPWIQINGSINRSGLESLLVGVLTYIAKNPSISLYDLQRKFEPALLPQWTRELLEILLKLEMVKWYKFEVPKFTLFSYHSSGGCTLSTGVTGFENEKVILIEPDVNCLTKLSMFISNETFENILDWKDATDMSSAVDQPSEVERQDVSQDGNNKRHG